jgi:hypothetical protein
MSYPIELNDEEERRLRAAKEKGMNIEWLFRQYVLPFLPGEVETPKTTEELFAQWEKEDAQLSDEERTVREAEAEALRQRLAANRLPDPNAEALRLIRLRREEAAQMSEEEKAQADRDLAEFKANINANRIAAGERPIY